jgi:hypothetical protein
MEEVKPSLDMPASEEYCRMRELDPVVGMMVDGPTISPWLNVGVAAATGLTVTATSQMADNGSVEDMVMGFL